MKRIIVRIIYIILIIAILGLYAYDVLVKHADPTDNLLRTISIVCLCIAGLIRTVGRKRETLSFYEAKYPDILTHAFADQPFWRNKLLCAVRLYNEDKCDKAVKYLTDLREKCRTKEDYYAVFLFAALCFTDMGIYDLAESAYNTLIHNDLADSRIFSNLGHVQQAAGKHEKSLISYNHALEYDRRNENAYNNIAQAHFRVHELDQAIPYAQKALEINPRLHAASSLLAIIYALTNDAENAEKYFHMAISSGRDPKELKEAIEYYRTAQWDSEEDTTEEFEEDDE